MCRTYKTLLFLLLAATMSAQWAHATVSSATINVPHKAGPAFEIARLKVTISVDADAPVTFRISHANGSQVIANVDTLALSPGTTNCFGDSTCFKIYPVGPSGRSDILAISTPSAMAPMGDPARRKYTFVFNLDGNSDVNCASFLGADEQWTIERTAGPQIEKICAQSLDHQTGAIGVCNNVLLRVVPQSEGIATVMGLASNLQGCRVGVDCILVLDRSGSMDDPVSGGSMTTKIQRLKDSVLNFITQWNNVRTNEAAEIVAPADQIGVVFFETNAAWLKDLKPASTTTTGLSSFAAVQADIAANVPSISTAGATSIGDGLIKADAAFSGGALAANRKVVLLMTDGMQNVDAMARLNPMNLQEVQTTTLGVASDVVNQPPLQIYALTVGTGMFVDDAINQQLSQATNGFLLNTETDATILPTLFVELLQNFVRFATVETLRIVGESVTSSTPFVTTIPVTRTMKSMIFNLTWDRPGVLRLIIDPPNGAPQIVRNVMPGDPPHSLSVPLPLIGQNPMGDWKVTVRGVDVSGSVPFSLIVLGDDATIDSELVTEPKQYRPGDRVIVHARVRELEKTLTALGSAPGDRIVAQLVSPDASLGDLLSASNASSTPPPGADAMTPAEAKLRNMLQANPNAIPRASNLITLTDDGNAANGDTAAGDGIYSGSFPAQLEGHYNFLIGVEGQSANSGRFSRQQLRTVYVKPTPDPGTTEVTSSVVVLTTGSFVNVQVTPKTKTGHLTGPGAGPYLWVTTSTGVAVPMHDNLNGTYSAQFPFTGSAPPFDVHFIDDPVKIPETITSQGDLPVPLGPGNVLVGGVTPGGGAGGGPAPGTLRFFVDLGPNFPHGSFSNGTDGKWSINAGIERFITSVWSVEGILGYHRFESPFASNPHIWQLSGGGKRYFGTAPWHPFLDASIGAYRFDPGNSTKFGANVGGGVLFDVSPTFGIEGVYQYHTVNTSGSATRFSTLQAGVRFQF